MELELAPPSRLQSVRVVAGLSIRQLADKAGIDRNKISRWERGDGVRTIRDAIALATALGVNVETLFAEGE